MNVDINDSKATIGDVALSSLRSKLKPSYGELMSQVQILVGLPVVETKVRTCIEEASRSAKPSGRSMYGMAPCHTDYRSGCIEQSTDTQDIGLDPT
eukprot:9560444-Ditylum_brightwellii.AAC.1